MDSSPKSIASPADAARSPTRHLRPNYRLHAATWVMVTVVALALANLQLERPFRAALGEGWPLRMVEYEISREQFVSRTSFIACGAGFMIEQRISWSAIELNIGFWLMLVLGTAAVFESWLRRARRWQVTMQDVLGITFVIAVLIAERHGALNMCELARRLNISPSAAYLGASWWVRGPIYVAIGCLIFAAARSLIWLIHQVLVGAMLVEPASGES